MLVVDRRDDPGAYAPGANRAEVQEARDRDRELAPFAPTILPARVEVERAPAGAGTGVGDGAGAGERGGVWCVTATPGPRALVRLLLERVWGVESADV